MSELKWSDEKENECTLLRQTRFRAGINATPAYVADVTAALRANPEAMAEVVLRLADEALPHMNESLDWAKEKMRAAESRALAAEKSRDVEHRQWCEARAEWKQAQAERDAAVAMLKEAEDALLEAQTERDSLQERLDVYEPPYKPRKYV